MAKILIVYGTSYGQTEKIVRRIDQVLVRQGHVVSVYKGKQLPPEVAPGNYDAYLVAGSVIVGKHQRCVAEFVRRYLHRLNAARSAFISVSGSAGDSPDQAVRLAESFLHQTSWHPAFVRCFAGAMAFTRYPWWLRWVMKAISRSHGGPTDTSRDYELSDWAAVDQFAADFSKALSPVPGSRTAAAAGQVSA